MQGGGEYFCTPAGLAFRALPVSSLKATVSLMNEIAHYLNEAGKDLYQEWLDRLKDRTAKARIRKARR